jgi:SAM-dependent methyltransferase
MAQGLTPDAVPWMEQMFVRDAAAFSSLVDRMPLPADLAATVPRLTRHGSLAGDVLDLCCGNGRLAPVLAPAVRSITGLDFSEPLIAIARARHEHLRNVRFICGDASRLREYVSPGFDLIVRLYTSLGYFDHATEVSIFRECAAVANAGAHLLLDSFNGEWFASHPEVDRTRAFGDFELREVYRYDASSSTVACAWSSPQFASTIVFSLFLHDRVSSERLLVEAGWTHVRHYEAYTGKVIGNEIPERMLIAARKAP